MWGVPSALVVRPTSTGRRQRSCVRRQFLPVKHSLTFCSPGFLIILLSTTIYTPPNLLHSTTNLPLEHLTHSLERRLVLSLLCSFLNTSLTSTKASAGIGGQIPYTHLISKAADERRTLVRASFTMLLVALDHRREDVTQMGDGKDENAFRYFVSKLVSTANCHAYQADLGLAPERGLLLHPWRDTRDIGRARRGQLKLPAWQQKARALHPRKLHAALADGRPEQTVPTIHLRLREDDGCHRVYPPYLSRAQG